MNAPEHDADDTTPRRQATAVPRSTATRRARTVCVVSWLIAWWFTYWHLALFSWLFLLGLLAVFVAVAAAVVATLGAVVIVWRHGLRAVLVPVLAGLVGIAVAAALWMPETFAVIRYVVHRSEFADITRIADERARDVGPRRTDVPLPYPLASMSLTGRVRVWNRPTGAQVFVPVFAGIPDEEMGFAHGGVPEEMVVVCDLPDGWHWVST